MDRDSYEAGYADGHEDAAPEHGPVDRDAYEAGYADGEAARASEERNGKCS